MAPLEAALLILIIALPFHWLVLREFDRLTDPAHIRRKGVVIVVEDVLQARSEPIGRYMGRPVWATVTFMDMQYRFDRVIDRRKRNSIAARELFLEPGLVYVTD
jgi:hypothetical protein